MEENESGREINYSRKHKLWVKSSLDNQLGNVSLSLIVGASVS